jgi:mRNA interferase MazF
VEVKRGDVVLIVASNDLGRPRPGVVVQADDFADDLSTVFICPMSSDIHEDLPLRPLVDPTPASGLRLRSQIMTDKMVALRRDRVRRVVGSIDAKTSEQLNTALLVVLGLGR